ncbi:MAG: aminopeptidase [Rouxiella aceris]|uniref:aminopeptidase n=1 Tax=Rouxiella aceris TaxID=2703884 RepID=UPI00284057B8|nr:aminopeptidase [Rouxiella aceris]MDR3433212.1 aminopeptidase [Rouxiella aceris]
MFSLRHVACSALLVMLSGVNTTYAAGQPVKAPAMGKIADQQTRHIATYYPGRMAGSPAELIAADYLQQTLSKMGYQSRLHAFDARYLYSSQDGHQNMHSVHATSVIADRQGEVRQQIVVMANFDTYLPQSDSDSNHNLGGLTLQGVDDNASGVGVMLELAQRMSEIPTHYSLRFVALSAQEAGEQGAKDYVDNLGAEEKKHTLLVINLSSLIVGERLYFNSGVNTSAAVSKLSRDKALSIARRLGITATSSPTGVSCCEGMKTLDSAHIPLLLVTASDWQVGNNDGQQQRAISEHFPTGSSRHQGQIDNLQYLDRYLPGRIASREKDSVRILLPLLKELANPLDKN